VNSPAKAAASPSAEGLIWMFIFSRGILAGWGNGMGLADAGTTELVKVRAVAAKMMDNMAFCFVI
jgi:hypothetical protein